MKIRDAKQIYGAQLDALQERKRTLSKLLKEQETGAPGAPAFDRVELSKELSQVNAQYESTRGVMEGILAREQTIHNSEVAKQQNEALAEAAEETIKMMEVFRRISSGAKVPPEDERKLIEYNHEMYMAAKAAAMLAQRNDKEYDSLWEDEEENAGETPDAQEIAENSEISVSAPKAVADSAADLPSAPAEP